MEGGEEAGGLATGAVLAAGAKVVLARGEAEQVGGRPDQSMTWIIMPYHILILHTKPCHSMTYTSMSHHTMPHYTMPQVVAATAAVSTGSAAPEGTDKIHFVHLKH